MNVEEDVQMQLQEMCTWNYLLALCIAIETFMTLFKHYLVSNHCFSSLLAVAIWPKHASTNGLWILELVPCMLICVGFGIFHRVCPSNQSSLLSGVLFSAPAGYCDWTVECWYVFLPLSIETTGPVVCKKTSSKHLFLLCVLVCLGAVHRAFGVLDLHVLLRHVINGARREPDIWTRLQT